jgi:hypothetical protein
MRGEAEMRGNSASERGRSAQQAHTVQHVCDMHTPMIQTRSHPCATSRTARVRQRCRAPQWPTAHTNAAAQCVRHAPVVCAPCAARPSERDGVRWSKLGRSDPAAIPCVLYNVYNRILIAVPVACAARQSLHALLQRLHTPAAFVATLAPKAAGTCRGCA